MSEEGAFGVVAEKIVTLRAVKASDLDMLREHRNQWETRRFLGNDSVISKEDQEKWFPIYGEGVRIAEQDGLPIGIARVVCNFVNGARAEVGCDVFREYRCRGYGKAIFQAACEHVRSAGAVDAELWVFHDNHPAVAIYKRFGFQFSSKEPVKWFMRPLDRPWDPPRPRAYAKMWRTL